MTFEPVPVTEVPDEPSASEAAAEPPRTQPPPPEPEPTPVEPPPPQPMPVAEPEQPAPWQLQARPRPPSPPPPVESPKLLPPAPRPPPRPRHSNVAPVAPPPVQTTASAPSVAPAANPSPPSPISAGWQSALSAWLQANKTYPDEARRRGDGGHATVRFTVNREGRVLDFQLLSKTGSAILDAAVERLLQGARLPPFPAGMDQDQVTVTLQIRYTLER